MANIKFSKKLFEKEIGKLNDEMQMRIAMFGTPVESVTDTEIEIEVFPNRPDLLSYQGFKKSFLAFLGKKTGLREYKVKKPEKDYKVIIDPSVKDVRPYTVCAIVKELILDENKIKELIDVQEKLHNTIGRMIDSKRHSEDIRPIQNELETSYRAFIKECDTIVSRPKGDTAHYGG